MSAVGYCYDNAFAESFFASIKSELLPAKGVFDSKSKAYAAVLDYLGCFCNRRRYYRVLG